MAAFVEIPGEGEYGGGAGGGRRVGPPINSVRLFDPTNSWERQQALDIEITWSYITKTVKSGQIMVNAKPRYTDTSMEGVVTTYDLGHDYVYSQSGLTIRKQIDEDTYEELNIQGLMFYNWVYQNQKVEIWAWQAFYKEGEEGFIIPLNDLIIKRMNYRDSTQMAFESAHVVLNCYQIVKTKWYQRSWFRVVLLVIAIVITVFTWGADGGSSIAAVLAMNAAIAIGATGALIVWVAATIYVLGAMILAKILSAVATKLFGEKWGAVISAIASIYLMGAGGFGGSVGATASTLTSVTASTIINISMSVVNVYAAYIQGSMKEFMVDSRDDKTLTDTEKRIKQIAKMTEQNLGNHLDDFDLQGYIQATSVQIEKPAEFLGRTLLVGGDICEITHGLVNDFAEVGLQLPNTG